MSQKGVLQPAVQITLLKHTQEHVALRPLSATPFPASHFPPRLTTASLPPLPTTSKSSVLGSQAHLEHALGLLPWPAVFELLPLAL